jgi:hypothetical protein
VVDNETIEWYLQRMGRTVQSLDEGLWLLDDGAEHGTEGAPPIIVKHEPPIVHLRMKVMSVPAEGREALYRRLLELNESSLVFGAYAVNGEDVYLIDTLRSEALWYHVLATSIESLVSAAHHLYSEFRPQAAAAVAAAAAASAEAGD